MVGYHSTSIKACRRILVEGFNPVKYFDHQRYHRSNKTWFTSKPQYMYGDVCIKVDLTGLNCVDNGDLYICKDKHIDPSRVIDYIKYNTLKETNTFDVLAVEKLFKGE